MTEPENTIFEDDKEISRLEWVIAHYITGVVQTLGVLYQGNNDIYQIPNIDSMCLDRIAKHLAKSIGRYRKHNDSIVYDLERTINILELIIAKAVTIDSKKD